MFTAAIALLIQWATFTPAEVDKLVWELSPRFPEEMRYKATVRLWKYAAHPAMTVALPTLEKTARSDSSPRARAIALFALGQAAKARGTPCPEVAFDALYDEEIDNVHLAATQVLYWHRPLPPDAEAKLLRFAKSAGPERRERGASVLADHFPKSPAAHKIIREVTEDPDPQRRHNGFAYLYQATKKISDIFPHIMKLQAEFAITNEPGDDAADEKKQHHVWLLVVNFGMAQFLADWLQDRPAELRDEIVAALGHESSQVRLATLFLLGRLGGVVADPTQIAPSKMTTKAWEFQFDPKKLETGMQSVTQSAAVRQKVKELAVKDPFNPIRTTAKEVLGKLAE